ncbi:MAG TPA: SagB/ThcOx family dehydrogenase [Pyrinomonadaceae bacterium]
MDRLAFLDAVAHGSRRDGKAPLANDLFGEIDADSARHLAHWIERGWHTSLEYYLWSRHSKFIDENDSTGDLRRDAIRTYLEKQAPPARIKPEGEYLLLPAAVEAAENLSLGELLLRRRTQRTYRREPVSLSSLSSLLWFGLNAVRKTRASLTDNDLLSYLKSYGVAFDFYLVIYDVESLASGTYFYDIRDHAVLLSRAGLFRNEMTELLSNQPAPETAAWSIVLVADLLQYQWRYRHERALRNLYIEAGRIGQHLILTGTLFGLGTLPTPALSDRGLSALLQLDPLRQTPVYSLTMGLDRRPQKK